ncbi:MAG: proline dehydrogenase, partial [Polyangiaceae bacterium]|nr:proline dehydrogenase [Polyangiaceae bacterium]
ALGDPRVTLFGTRDVGAIADGQVHVYGRDATIAAVRAAARTGVVVRGHGAGLGVAFVSRGADCAAAAEALAHDVIAFDQRGCSSPRVALIDGDVARAESFCSALSARLAEWGGRVPRGNLSESERIESRAWRDTHAFAGRLYEGEAHAVALAADPLGLIVGPAGRHVAVAAVDGVAMATVALAPIARFVVAVGSDDIAAGRGMAPAHARLGPLGSMQRPPLDGPVDRRT